MGISFKSPGMPNSTVISIFNASEEGNTLNHYTRSISTIFKILFPNLAKSLLIKLPKAPDKCNLKPAIQHYSRFAITFDFCLVDTTEKNLQNHARY